MKLNILVVDDDRATLDLISQTLAVENIPCLLASNAETALEQFRQGHPRVIISAMQLADMSGTELMDRILASDQGACGVLTPTDYSTDAAMSAVRRGACDYLARPLDPEKLPACIRKLTAEAETREK